MKIITTNRIAYTIQNESGIIDSEIAYKDNSLSYASLKCDNDLFVIEKKNGSWGTTNTKTQIKVSTVEVNIGGTMQLNIGTENYTFKKPLNWKMRLVLFNSDNEEILAILPKVNWSKKCYDFVLQINEELMPEFDRFIILQALHCAICSMAMMNGVLMPTVVSFL